MTLVGITEMRQALMEDVHQIATNSDEEYNELRQQSSFACAPQRRHLSSFWYFIYYKPCLLLAPLLLPNSQSQLIPLRTVRALLLVRRGPIFISSQTPLKSPSRRHQMSATRLPNAIPPATRAKPFQTNQIVPSPETIPAPRPTDPVRPPALSCPRSPPSLPQQRPPMPGDTATTR